MRELVWHTQHPYRHKRNLQLGLDNEYSLNMRIHPLAAVWANAAWDRALRQMEAREEELLAVLRSRGIEAGIKAASLEPIYRKPAYRAQYGETPKATCPVAERQADRCFSLTLSP